MAEIPRSRYRALYGPTAGDRIRLADTDLVIEVERDDCFGGDEAVFGGGKVIRESMGQSVATRAEGTPDLVITGAVILDHWGIVKADIGVRDGRIVAIGGHQLDIGRFAIGEHVDKHHHHGPQRRRGGRPQVPAAPDLDPERIAFALGDGHADAGGRGLGGRAANRLRDRRRNRVGEGILRGFRRGLGGFWHRRSGGGGFHRPFRARLRAGRRAGRGGGLVGLGDDLGRGFLGRGRLLFGGLGGAVGLGDGLLADDRIGARIGEGLGRGLGRHAGRFIRAWESVWIHRRVHLDGRDRRLDRLGHGLGLGQLRRRRRQSRQLGRAVGRRGRFARRYRRLLGRRFGDLGRLGRGILGGRGHIGRIRLGLGRGVRGGHETELLGRDQGHIGGFQIKGQGLGGEDIPEDQPQDQRPVSRS